MPSDKAFKAAILGFGSIGKRRLGCLRRLGCEDILVHDPDPRARKSAEECGAKFCASPDDLWVDRPDVALVACPSPWHLEMATMAVRNGCHLFVEKPLADKLDGTAELSREVERRNLLAMVGCNMRFHPGPATVQRLLSEGVIGRPLAARLETGSYLPNWRPWIDYRESISARPELGGGVLLECIHEIDLSLWLFGPGKLLGSGTKPAETLGLGVEGLAEMLISHDSGVFTSVHLNFVQRNYSRSCRVIGSEGSISWDFRYPWVEVQTEETSRAPLDPNWCLDDMYDAEMRYFLDSVRSGRPPSASLNEGIAALDIASRARGLGRATAAGMARRRKRMQCVAIVQARMSSSRLPGKVLSDVDGAPMLAHVLEQVSKAKLIQRVVVATTTSGADDAIVAFCSAHDVECYRGSEQDVLDRYYQAALKAGADTVVRLTADCPLLDPAVIDKVIEVFNNGEFDYVSNTIHRTYPDGLDAEVFSFEALERAWKEARWTSEREHVTPYIWKHPEIFRLGKLVGEEDHSDLRWTVDVPEDLELVRAIYGRLGGQSPSMQAVLDLLNRDDALTEINGGVGCNEGYRKSIREDHIAKREDGGTRG